MKVNRKRDDFNGVRGEREEVMVKKENLKVEGEFLDYRYSEDYKEVRGERKEIIKFEEKMKIED